MNYYLKKAIGEFIFFVLVVLLLLSNIKKGINKDLLTIVLQIILLIVTSVRVIMNYKKYKLTNEK